MIPQMKVFHHRGSPSRAGQVEVSIQERHHHITKRPEHRILVGFQSYLPERSSTKGGRRGQCTVQGLQSSPCDLRLLHQIDQGPQLLDPCYGLMSTACALFCCSSLPYITTGLTYGRESARSKGKTEQLLKLLP